MKIKILAALCLATNVYASPPMPATTMPVPETNALEPLNGKGKWYIRTEYMQALSMPTAQGANIAVGKLFKYLSVDGWVLVGSGSYDAFNVNRTDLVPTPDLQPVGSEADRFRIGSSNISFFGIGPGVGLMYRLFESNRWVELGHLGLGYARFTDQDNGFPFYGAMAEMKGALGYRLDPVLLTAGLSWSLAYLQRADNGFETTHANFLEMQWWAVQIGLQYWIK